MVPVSFLIVYVINNLCVDRELLFFLFSVFVLLNGMDEVLFPGLIPFEVFIGRVLLFKALFKKSSSASDLFVQNKNGIVLSIQIPR